MRPARRLKRETIRIGSLEFKIESLDDLEGASDELLSLAESTGNEELLEDDCPYFGVVWPSALALASRLASLGPGELAGTSLLEVGCGLALPSLVAARLGARVVATDRHRMVPRLLERALARNGVSGVEYRHLDWHGERAPLGCFDRVVGSDVLYEREVVAPVADLVEKNLCPGGEATITDPGRPYLQEFAGEMEERGFRAAIEVASTPNRLDPRDLFVLVFRRESRAGG